MDSYFPMDGEQVVEKPRRPHAVFIVLCIPFLPVIALGFIIGLLMKPFSIGFYAAWGLL